MANELKYLWLLGVADVVQVLSPAWARRLRARYTRLTAEGKRDDG